MLAELQGRAVGVRAEAERAVVGVLLAGGRARRMGGGQKCLRLLAGRTLLDRVIGIVRDQVETLALNANGDPECFADYGLPVLRDVVEGFAGPLAGVLTGMSWARQRVPSASCLLTVPTDAPFLPRDTASRLRAALDAEAADIAFASSAGRMHPVVGLWSVALCEDLRTALVEEGIRKIDHWAARHRIARVEWPCEPIDPFFNVNRPEDLAEAERLLAAQGPP
jgi:molybdopterin-guanine dinucleotide biosynthesis protein A